MRTIIIMKSSLILLISTCQIISTVNYCNICPNMTHTMCKYENGPSKKCVDYKEFNLTLEFKNYILDVHNDIRNYVASGKESRGKLGGQPPASNMMMLKWSDELSEIAQRWADQCVDLEDANQHDSCRKTDETLEVGQNILTNVIHTSSEVLDIFYLIMKWYDQVVNVIPADVDYFSEVNRGKFKVGHYTQLVWADTRSVGCGGSFYKPSKTSEVYYQRLVCNYAPAGNIIGRNVYRKGPACAGCTGNCDRFRTSLCRDYGESPTINSNDVMVFEGKWFNGRCRCNIVYRSLSEMHQASFCLLTVVTIKVFFII